MSKKTLLAVIDLGSLSLRLKIFELGDKQIPKEIESVRKYLSSTSRAYSEGIIPPHLSGEIVDVLSGFAAKIREYKIKEVICVATSAFREAKNKAMVIEQIRVQTGIKVTVLDNAQERYYHNLAVKESQPNFAKLVTEGTMVLDIGAGSMQATLYDKSDLVFSQNTRLGSLRVSELLSRSGQADDALYRGPRGIRHALQRLLVRRGGNAGGGVRRTLHGSGSRDRVS